MTGLPYKSAQTTGTVAVAKWGRVTLLSPRASPHGYAWRDTLAHELTHLAVTRASRDQAPLWLQEGVAKREEVRWRAPGPFDERPSPDAIVQRGLELNLGLPLDKLGPSIAMLPSADAAMVAFAEVTSFVRFYVQSAGRGRGPARSFFREELRRRARSPRMRSSGRERCRPEGLGRQVAGLSELAPARAASPRSTGWAGRTSDAEKTARSARSLPLGRAPARARPCDRGPLRARPHRACRCTGSAGRVGACHGRSERALAACAGTRGDRPAGGGGADGGGPQAGAVLVWTLVGRPGPMGAHSGG